MLTFGAQYGSSVQFQKMNGNKNFLFLWGFPRNMKLECFPSITYFPLKEVSFLDSARNFLFLNDLFCNCLHSISWQQRLTKAFHNINCVFYCKVKTFLFLKKHCKNCHYYCHELGFSIVWNICMFKREIISSYNIKHYMSCVICHLNFLSLSFFQY